MRIGIESLDRHPTVLAVYQESPCWS
jgi:hypothetical protein